MWGGKKVRVKIMPTVVNLPAAGTAISVSHCSSGTKRGGYCLPQFRTEKAVCVKPAKQFLPLESCSQFHPLIYGNAGLKPLGVTENDCLLKLSYGEMTLFYQQSHVLSFEVLGWVSVTMQW